MKNSKGDRMIAILTGERAKEQNFGIICPEAYMHPDEQFEYAKKLVKTSQNEDVFLTTYSPLLIEAIDAWCEYYSEYHKVELKTFLLINNKIKEIKNDELYKIYDNLGDAYDKIDQLRLLIKWRE